MLMHDGFNRVNTGLNGSGLSSRNNGYGCKDWFKAFQLPW